MPRRRARTSEFFPGAPPSGQYTGQRPTDEPWLQDLLRAGRGFWATRGVQVPERIALDISDDLRNTDDDPFVSGRGWDPSKYGEARIALDSGLVSRQLARARSQRRSTAERRDALKLLASTLLHEQGHVGGVTHSGDGGFMGAYGPEEMPHGAQPIPQEVAREIRRLVPRRRAKTRMRQSEG